MMRHFYEQLQNFVILSFIYVSYHIASNVFINCVNTHPPYRWVFIDSFLLELCGLSSLPNVPFCTLWHLNEPMALRSKVKDSGHDVSLHFMSAVHIIGKTVCH